MSNITFINKLEEDKGLFNDKLFDDLKLPHVDYKNTMMRHILPVRINEDYELSVQAGYHHYSVPRKTIDLSEYSHFEIAVLYKDGLTESFEIFKGFDRLDELSSYQDGTVYPYVPANLIEDIFKFFNI